MFAVSATAAGRSYRFLHRLSDHVSNFLDVRGRVPEDKPAMLAQLDQALQWPVGAFRPPTERLVGLGL